VIPLLHALQPAAIEVDCGIVINRPAMYAWAALFRWSLFDPRHLRWRGVSLTRVGGPVQQKKTAVAESAGFLVMALVRQRPFGV